MLRNALLQVADSAPVSRAVTTWPVARRQALRFVAGETMAEGLAAAEDLAGKGAAITLDHVGEHVGDLADARRAADTYRTVLTAIGDRGLPAGIAVKPTQLGLGLDSSACADLLGRLAAAAAEVDAHVTLEMEDHRLTEATAARWHPGGRARAGLAWGV